MTSGGRESRALARFAAVSAVTARVTAGMSLSRAIEEVTKTALVGPDGLVLAMSRASLYRWHAAFTAKKFAGLLSDERPRVQASRVLPPAFLDFMVSEKKLDPDASLPEIIRRAEVDGIVSPSQLSRTSVWRAANRLRLPIFADKMSRHDDARRFAHEHRMRMVLCDGKHFRVGATKVKRVVFSYLDDATRKVLGAVVGTAEDRSLFLRGLMQVIKRAGIMDGLYLDRGSAFTADDSALVCGRLGIPLVFGRVRYPAGHGKIERYNQTILKDLLRGISVDKAIDVSCPWLQTMIEHYLAKIYNLRSHEGLDGLSPDERWDADRRELRLVDDLRKVEDHFIVTEMRRVSRDNVVMLDDEPYEMPQGQRGQRVQVFRHFLDDRFTVLHEGRHVVLAKVDLHANAKAQRTRRMAATETVPVGKIRTAAQRAFAKDFASVVSPDGDFYDRSE